MKRRFLQTTAASLALAALATLGLAGPVAAQVQDRTFKLGLQNPKGHPLEMGATRFAELLAAKSGGKLKVNVFAGGQLGADAPTVSALQGGTVEITVLNSGILASQVREFSVYDFPFMFASAAEADAVVDGPFGQKLHGLLADKGLVGLTYWELGFRQMTNSRRPITTVDDISGLKLRVIPNAINVDWVKALGGNPTPMAFTELFAALEQRAVDGQENPLSVILANKFGEVQKHLAITNHQYNPQSFLFSKRVWDTLSADERRMVSEAAVEAGRYQRTVNREAAASQLAELRKVGMQVTEFNAAEQAKLRSRLVPVIEKHGAPIAATVAELQAELAKVRR